MYDYTAKQYWLSNLVMLDKHAVEAIKKKKGQSAIEEAKKKIVGKLREIKVSVCSYDIDNAAELIVSRIENWG